VSAIEDASFVERHRRQGDPRHGTPSGAARHASVGEEPCDACRAAKAEYDRDWRAAPERTKRNRLHAKAQALALKSLRHNHPDEYREFYLAHKAALLAEQEQR